LKVFDPRGNEDADVMVDQWGGELALVHEFGRYATILGGVRRYTGEVKVDLGDIPDVDDEGSFDGGEFYFQLYSDRLDDRYFPNSGSKATFTYLKSTDELGADATFEQVGGSIFGATSFGPHTFMGSVSYSTTLDSDAPVYALFRAGGLFNLSGIQPNELTGQHFGGVFTSYRYEPGGEAGGLFPAYVGFSAEYGNATDDREDVFGDGIANGSVYFGYRSPVGPLYWGVGFAEGGQRAYFLRIGNVFGTSSIGR
jgi:NTE family protein